MPDLAQNLAFFWNNLVGPRLQTATHHEDAYAWGGSFSGSDINQGTDCSGAVSAELSAIQRGPYMIYQRQFYTGTFAGITPGQVGPFAGIRDTQGLICIADPTQAPADALMIIAIRQRDDPTDAHMICRVQNVDIEMGGNSDDYHTSITDDTCAQVTDTGEFNQWFVLRNPGIYNIGADPDVTVLAPSVASQFL
jgi:hypothetical protein